MNWAAEGNHNLSCRFDAQISTYAQQLPGVTHWVWGRNDIVVVYMALVVPAVCVRIEQARMSFFTEYMAAVRSETIQW